MRNLAARKRRVRARRSVTRNLISISLLDAISDHYLTERRQLHEIGWGDGLDGLSRLTPCGQAADQDERVESFFPQHVRHPGAGRFAYSSAVEIHVFVG